MKGYYFIPIAVSFIAAYVGLKIGSKEKNMASRRFKVGLTLLLLGLAGIFGMAILIYVTAVRH